MAFLKRSLARLDLLFKKKPERRAKFVECVEKVIEARRSGCIDEDGNFVKPLDDIFQQEVKPLEDVTLRQRPQVPNYRVSVVEPRPRPRARLIHGIPPTYCRPDKLRRRKELEQMQIRRQRQDKQRRRASPVLVDGAIIRPITPTNSSDEEDLEVLKPDRITAVSNPMYRESYPLPEEDDGSEGYASASEVDHFEFNPTAFLERNRTSGNPLHHHVHRYHGYSDHSSDEVEDEQDSRAAARRVRFSDDVQEIEDFMVEEEAGPRRKSSLMDPIILPVHSKIDMFEKVSHYVKPLPPLLNRHSDPGPRIPPRPQINRLPNSVTKEKVCLFEELSNPDNRPVPPPRPRRRKLEAKMNETKLKIHFFEQLSKCSPSSPVLTNRASTPCL